MRWILPTTALVVLALDLTSKYWAEANLQAGNTRPLVPGILQLTLTTNAGAAFGLGRQSGWLMTMLALFILFAVLAWVFKREKQKEKPALYERLGIGLLIGGALGNLWDRLFVGKVTDFLELSFVSFPIFNLADVCIDLGAALILLKLLLPGKPRLAGADDKRGSSTAAGDALGHDQCEGSHE